MITDKPLMLKELPKDERPREKMMAKGAASLSNAELLAILLRTGTKADSAVRLAERLLKRQEELGLAGLAVLTTQEMRKIKGIGIAKAVTVAAAVEIGKRLASLVPGERPSIMSPADAANYMMPKLRYETKEHFVGILLSTKNHIIAAPTISVGTLNASLVHPRELFKEAINYSAASIILVHNHPSGDPTPSTEDIALTQNLVKAGKLLDISVLDHVIIGDNKYVSLKEKGIIA